MTETFKALEVPLAPGITLVEASAGTGKTYALTELVLRLVLEDGALGAGTPDLRKLLVVTFTVAATEELKTRIRRALREALDAFEGGDASGVVEPFIARYGATPEAREAGATRLRHALGQVGEAAVFTIHGFCKRVLERSAFESGEPFAFDFTEDADRLQTRVARDVWHGLVGGHADLGPLALAAGWNLDRLKAHAGHARQFVDTRILPEAAPLAEAVETVRDARQRLREAWHPAAQEDVVDAGLWRMDKKNKPFTTDLRGVFARVDAFARGDWGEIGAVRMCEVETVSGAIKNGSKAGKAAVVDVEHDPGFLACSAVTDAVGKLEIALVHAFVASLEAGTRRAKAAASLLTFDDLIERLDRALAHPSTGPALRRAIQDQFAVALIDEFQDTDPTQYRIFRRAFGGMRDGEAWRDAGSPLAPEADADSPTRSPLPLGEGQGEGHTERGSPDSPEASGERTQLPLEGRPLFFIGDPKQAIYAFRGADVFAYLEARGDADRRLTLGTNYRSSPDLVKAVNALFGRLGSGGRPFVYDGIPFEPVQAKASDSGIRGVSPEAPLVWWAADELERGRGNIVTKGNAREAATGAVVAEICRLLNNERAEIRDRHTGLWRRLEAGDLAVLTRTNAQARDLQDRLRRANVNAVVGKGDDIRQSREMDEIERVLRAMARPTDSRRVRAALATEMWGWTAADLAPEADGETSGADRMVKVMEGLRKDRALWRRGGVFGALTAWVRREGVRQRLHQYADRERRLTNLRHCLELLHEAETSEDRSVDELLHWVRTRQERTFAERQRVEMRLESDDHAVQLVTMHNAKGLEYPVVFAPFVWDDKDKEYWRGGTFEERPPVAHVASGGAVYDLGSEAQATHRALADAERLAESLRLTYVALTRARERLYIVWGPLSGGHASGIGHLLRDLPLPMAQGLASFDDATRKTALEHLRTSMTALEDWIARAELGHVMAVAPLPQGGGRVERETLADDASGVRTLTHEARSRVTSPEARASFSSWASGAPRDERADDGDASPDADTPEAGIFAFASGPRAGTCLHEILENAAFRVPESYRDAESANVRAVARVLRRHGLHDGESRVHRARLQPLAAITEMIGTLAETQIPDLGFALQDVPRGGFAPEWRFVAPLARVAPSEIADLFREHGDEALQDYADIIARLAPEAVDGLFVGSADLVVQHPDEERWSLIDWKSNHLGPSAAHYGAEPLARTMRAHHYLLQAHLYVAGLHRHLRTRLADYDYDRHIGGAVYAFLRGLPSDLATEAQTGFHVVRPPRELIEALDALLFAPLAERTADETQTADAETISPETE